MTHLIFTKRRLEKHVVKSVGEGSVTWDDNSGHGVPPYVVPELIVGGTYYLELYKFNDIGGIMRENGEYLFHRSDEYFAQRLADYLSEAKARQEKNYLDNKNDWLKRTYALSPRYRDRLDRFINDPEKGEEFRTQGMGWGYELIICELAQMYEKSGGVDNDEIMDYARQHGTSGNQHDCAKAWAKNQDVKI